MEKVTTPLLKEKKLIELDDNEAILFNTLNKILTPVISKGFELPEKNLVTNKSVLAFVVGGWTRDKVNSFIKI